MLAELSLMNRIDTDLESLFLIDNTETGNPILDPALQAIAAEPGHRTTQYWIERLAPLADSVIEHTLDRLVDLNILQHYEGDPTGEDMTLAAIDVTHRFLMECMRMYPIVPMSMRDVMNACVVEGYQLPVGTRLHIAQTATHYMGDVFPDPLKFDIDRYKPPGNEHHGTNYAPYGLGTHSCLGSRWMDLQLTVNVLMLARHFTFDVYPSKYKDKLKINPIPSLKPHKSLKLVVTEKRGL